MRGSNFLATIFKWINEVVDAAESPFARLAALLLPILAPIVPAFFTAIGLFKAFLDLLLSINTTWISNQTLSLIALVAAVVSALMLELLGWVGTIALVRFLYRWAKAKNSHFIVPTILMAIAYIFYLTDLVAVNVYMNILNSNKTIVIALLSGFSIPAGLVFAVNLTSSEEDKKEYQLRQEQREDRLKSKALKQGINVFQAQAQTASETPARSRREKHASDYRDRIISMLDDEYKRSGKVLQPKEITARLKLDHTKSKGFVSTLTSSWCRERNIVKTTDSRKKFGF